MTDWISVKDRLPEYGVDVLILDVWGDIEVDHIDKEMNEIIIRDGVNIPLTHKRFQPLYWMPLPEPPKEEEDL